MRAVPEVEGVLQLEAIAALPGIAHGFETRRGRLGEALPAPVARLRQVHGADWLRLPDDPAERAPFFEASVDNRPAADALITDQPGVAVAVAVADCLPILIASVDGRAVAAVHGGWRGLAAGIIERTIEAMAGVFDCRPAQLALGIGPRIGPCCFEVGNEVIEAFAERGYERQARVETAAAPRPFCDLPAVAAAIAVDAGVDAGAISDSGLCTQCNSEWLWSYRVDAEHAGRMLGGIARL